MTHEKVHATACQNLAPLALAGRTWKHQVGLINVYKNEIEAYDSEIKFLEDQRNRLKQPCSRGWHGEIVMHYEVNQPQN